MQLFSPTICQSLGRLGCLSQTCVPATRTPARAGVLADPLGVIQITGQGNNSLGVAALWSAALDSAPAVKKLLWDRPAENSQQLPLLFASPPEDSASSLLTDALKLILSDIPTFLAFAGEGRFTTDSYPNVPLDPGFDLGTGLHTFVTSKLMQMNNYYAVPMDVVTDEMATKTAAENTDAVYHWSRNTHRLYELRAKGKPVIDKATLYEEHLMNNDWADAQLLFDGSYNCTAVGNAGGAIVHLPNNVTDVSCVSQLPMVSYFLERAPSFSGPGEADSTIAVSTKEQPVPDADTGWWQVSVWVSRLDENDCCACVDGTPWIPVDGFHT